jgi:hypothetical protein
MPNNLLLKGGISILLLADMQVSRPSTLARVMDAFRLKALWPATKKEKKKEKKKRKKKRF